MNTDINKEIEEMLKQFLEQFGADKIWVTPSRDNVETILEIWRFFGQSLHTIAEKARREGWIDGFMASGEGFNGEYMGGDGVTERRVEALYDRQFTTPQSNKHHE